jgi:drug/metabolite transporter (DMT)-like permease
MLRNARPHATSVAALLLLSLLWACGALRTDLLPGLVPDLLPHMERQAVPFALLAVVAGVIALSRRTPRPNEQLFRNAVLIGMGLFVVPGWLVSLADGWMPGLARTALFTLIPVFTLVFEPYVGIGVGVGPGIGAGIEAGIGPGIEPDRQSPGALLAALTAVLGALCVFPIGIPGSLEAGLELCAVILAAACVAVTNCKAAVVVAELAADSTAALAAIAGATAATGFAAASMVTEQPVWKWRALAPELLWSLAVEVPALLLLFWLMRRMSATHLATRYLIAPLLALLVGVAMIRPVLMLRTWLGLALMAAGAAYLLLAPQRQTESTGLSLRQPAVREESSAEKGR